MSDDLYDGPCEAGCSHFHGGEVRHHPDCGHYPESLTKLNADRIEELEAERDRLRYVLGGVAAAIDTGRNEPLVVWREQIEIALIPDTDKGDG